MEQYISIHAPAKGATENVITWEFLRRFQSTLPRRERPNTIFSVRPYTNFNPRSREGSDGYDGVMMKATEDFNPRSREGSDNSNSENLY